MFCEKSIHSNADIAPLFANAVCVKGNFISQTVWALRVGDHSSRSLNRGLIALETFHLLISYTACLFITENCVFVAYVCYTIHFIANTNRHLIVSTPRETNITSVLIEFRVEKAGNVCINVDIEGRSCNNYCRGKSLSISNVF